MTTPLTDEALAEAERVFSKPCEAIGIEGPKLLSPEDMLRLLEVAHRTGKTLLAEVKRLRGESPTQKVEQVRQAIFNVLSSPAQPNTAILLAAVYEALGFRGIDSPPRPTPDAGLGSDQSALPERSYGTLEPSRPIRSLPRKQGGGDGGGCCGCTGCRTEHAKHRHSRRVVEQ